jgi:RNA polymerase sigma-70 factor (ECF subfamily)
MGRLETSDTSNSLLFRLRDCEEAAWKEFFQIYTPAVYGYAIKKGVQPNDAEDVTQEVLVEVVRCIRSFEYQPEKGRFRDWLGTLVWRRLARHWKSQTKNVEIQSDFSQGAGQDPQWIDEFHATILHHSMNNIKSHFAELTWNAFLSVWKDGNSATETATLLGVPIEVVYNAKSRVLKLLEAEVVRISDDCAWTPSTSH